MTRPQLQEDILVALLRQCYFAPRCRSAIKRPPVHLQHHIRTLRTSTRQAQQNGKNPKLDGNGPQHPPTSRKGTDSLSPEEIYSLSPEDINSMSRAELKSLLAKVGLPLFPKTTQTTHPSSHDPKNIAILGGGITGLASTYYLSKMLPSAGITLYEASDRMGGWLRSKHINVGNGKVVFEQGPRTLRPRTPAGLVTLTLVITPETHTILVDAKVLVQIKELGLEDEMIITPEDSIAARSRFLYYPDHLVRMPGPGQGVLNSIWRLFTEPAFEGIFTGFAVESNKPRRSSDLKDESVGSFLERRLGNTHVGNNLASAVLHGIYAGDMYQLSIKSLQPIAWHIEGRYGSLFTGMKRLFLEGLRDIDYRDTVLFRLLGNPSDLAGGRKALDASVYSFKQGIGELSDALVAALKTNPKVRLKTGERVKKLSFDGGSNSLKVGTGIRHMQCIY
jgi:oxygen-dependent protoporphyrinogen oxidase